MAKQIEFNIVFAPVITEYIGKALETLYKHTDPEIFKVIIVDQTIAGVYDTVKGKAHVYVKPGRHLGFAQGMNTGWRLSTGPYTICANDDVEFMNLRWWPAIKEVFNIMPEVMAVAPMSPIETGWGYGINSDNFKCPDWGVVKGDKILPKKEDGTGFDYKENFTEEDYDWLLNYKGGHIEGMATWMPVFREDAVEKVGYFDERFYPGGGEDYDWVARCYSAGFRAISTTKSWVWHHWSKSIEAKDKLPARVRESFANVDDLWEIDETKRRNPIYHSPPRRRKSPEVFRQPY